jgi:hypothetical protein
MAWLLGVATWSAEGGVKCVTHRPSIEVGLQPPQENHPRARPEGNIVKSGIIE